MNRLDVILIIVAIAALLLCGFLASPRRENNTENFILGGRRLPWWLGGSAMVGGASNADSPLHQSGKIRRDGLGGAWFYWSQAFAQTWHGLVFSRLWRRTGVSTVVEFYEIRYAGRAAVVGRIWSMVFASLIEGTVGLALGLLAMIKICPVMFGFQHSVSFFGFAISPEIVIALAGVALGISYAIASGLLGVVMGDVVGFLVTIGSSYLLMFFVYRQVGYSHGLREGLERLDYSEFLSLTPAGGLAFLTFFFVQPVALLAGNNGLNQRFLAMRDERQAMLSGIWRLLNLFFIRCWPWYLCGLASLVLYKPGAIENEQAYPRLIVDCVPAGLRGLMFAGLLVAFIGSVSSSMHNAGSVVVNDFYRPYLVRHASERHYVWVIRITMLVMAVVATAISLASGQILRLLQFMITMSSAAGFVMLLRWFWWRINGCADCAAQILCFPATCFFILGPGRRWAVTLVRWCGGSSADDVFGVSFFLTLATTTLAWLCVMAFTKPEPAHKLAAFFSRVRPYGWWGPVAKLCPDVVVTDNFQQDLQLYGLGIALSISMLFGMGLLILGRPLTAFPLLFAGALCGGLLVRRIDRFFKPAENKELLSPQVVAGQVSLATRNSILGPRGISNGAGGAVGVVRTAPELNIGRSL
jgi:Na+/proline symporter